MGIIMLFKIEKYQVEEYIYIYIATKDNESGNPENPNLGCLQFIVVHWCTPTKEPGIQTTSRWDFASEIPMFLFLRTRSLVSILDATSSFTLQ